MPIINFFAGRTTIRIHAPAFLAGILLVQQLGELPSPWWGLGLIPLGLLFRWRPFGPLLWTFIAGSYWVTLVASTILARTLPTELEGKDVWLEGTVASIPEQGDRSLKFNFDVRRMVYAGVDRPGPGRVRLGLYRPDSALGIGEEWRFRVRLKRPHGFQNPGGFDYEGWLFRSRIRATGYVRADPGNRRLASRGSSFPLGRLRAYLANRIHTALPGSALAGIITALATGNRAGISDQQWRVMLRTGTNHLVAISGLHIGLVAGLVYFLVRWAWVLPGFTVLRWPAPKIAAVAALLAAVVYAALAGFAIPTQRALIMLAVAMSGVLFQRTLTMSQLLAAALFLVLLWDPLAVMSAGFWLSFAAVAVIITALAGRRTRARWWAKWGYIQWIIGIGLLPLLLSLYQQLPLSAPLVNMVAVPVIGLIVVPVTLAGAAASLLLPETASTFLFQLAAWLLHWLWPLLEYAAGLKHGVWVQHAPAAWALASGVLGALWLLAPRGLPARWLGGVWLLPLFLVRPAGPAAGEVWFTLLDVGQGLAAVVRTQEHALVYDSGPRFSARFDTGRIVIAPFLRRRGIGRIDVLLISHGDNDHIGGAYSLLEALPVTQTLSSVPERLPGARPCQSGQAWRWDGVDFKVLHPAKGRYSSENNASCVLFVGSRYGNILLTGDIEAAAEWAVIARHGEALAATVLVVPHHGSQTSSTQTFIETVRPKVALFPVGYRNRYRHPHRDVVARYTGFRAALYSSPDHGAIQVRLQAGGIRTSGFRQTNRRYWFAKSQQIAAQGR